jgi:hypothetical protein
MCNRIGGEQQRLYYPNFPAMQVELNGTTHFGLYFGNYCAYYSLLSSGIGRTEATRRMSPRVQRFLTSNLNFLSESFLNEW